MVVVGLTISMHLQQFEGLKFLIFSEGTCPGPPQDPCWVSNCPDLGGIVSILLENPKSWLDFSRDTVSIPILKISPHKQTSREI